MKLFVSLGLFVFALSFCNLSERLSQLKGGGSNNQNSSANSTTNSSKTSTTDETVEKPKLTASQQAISDGGQSVKWDDQGISWTLPKNWKKMNVAKTMFNYSSPDLAFLIANISVMPDNFPSETSLKATYETALQQLKNGKYENVRYLEIDGVKALNLPKRCPKKKAIRDGINGLPFAIISDKISNSTLYFRPKEVILKSTATIFRQSCIQ